MGDNVKPIKNVKIYNWQQGSQYEMDNTEINYAKKFGEIVNHFIRKNIREARISSPKFCLELHITGDTVCINHFKVYVTGKNIASNIYQKFEETVISVAKINHIEIWIGTDSGENKTEKFLIKNGFNEESIIKDFDPAYGTTYKAKKQI